MNKQVLIGLSTLSLVTILSGVALSSSNSFAASASTATAAVKIAASCTLTSTGGGNYSATIPNGTSAEISGSTLSASCNDAGGFSLYAVGYSNDTIGNNNMIGQSTNIATNTSGNDSYWAMKINPTTGNTPTIENSFNNYHIVPNALTMVASHSTTTGTGSLSVNATYKANISSTQLAGNYLGKVKYVLVHPTTADPGQYEVACEAGKICYNANITQTVGQMGKQSAADGDNVLLYASNFKRDGYGFAGWNTAYDYTGTFYGPNQYITAPTGTTANGLSLYAVWVKSAGTIQNWNECYKLIRDPADGTANLTSVTALTDSRDGNTYAVAKLADGKCWMIENLRLADKDSNNNYINLSSSNTHNPSLPLTNIYSTSTTSNHLTASSSVAYDATTAPEGWCVPSQTFPYNYRPCFDQSRLRTDNTTLFTNNTASNYDPSSDVYSYGNYYNWYSATAGNGKFDTSSGNVAGDICPTGWHLSTNNEIHYDTYTDEYSSAGEFYNLIADIANAYGVNTWLDAYNEISFFPTNFIYSGGMSKNDISSISGRGTGGAYWSSTSYTNQSVRAMVYAIDPTRGIGSIDLISTQGKATGRAVRCVSGT